MPVRLLLRLQRTGLIALGYFGAFYALVNSAAYPLLAGTNGAARAAFGAQISALGRQIAWLLPLPLHPETAAGYLQWRGYGICALAFSAWGLLSACGAVRRDEDRGLVDMWLASGMSRVRLLATRVTAFAVASLVVTLITGVAGWIGCAIASLPADPSGIMGSTAALWALTLASYAIGLLVAQLVAEYRAAVGAGAAVLVAMFLVDSLGRSSVARPGWTQVSIYALFNRTNAIAPGGTFDLGATLLMAAAALAAAGIAIAGFVRRDVGSAWIRRRSRASPAQRTPSPNPLLRVAVLRGLWVRRVPLILWIAGCAVFAFFVVGLIGVTYDLFTKTPSISGYLRGYTGNLRDALLALIWFALAQGLLAVLAITHVSRWASEDGSGVLELELAEPVTRWQVMFERAAELLVTLVAAAFVPAAVILLLAPSQHITVGVAPVLVATALLIPFGLTFAAAGAVLAGWRPRVAMGVLSTVAVVSYLVFQLSGLLRWPQWAQDLSVFQLYGTPLITPVFVGGLIAMCAIVVAGFGVAGVALSRRDVAR